MSNSLNKPAGKVKKMSTGLSDQDLQVSILKIAEKGMEINEDEAKDLINLISNLFRRVTLASGYETEKTKALVTKFRDAGRRSAPWRPTSSRVPGRPQDGGDGNRILRWLLPENHKFYATEVIATLVEVKYYLQTLSMVDAPDISFYELSDIFYPWLLEHKVLPGKYLDPVQLKPISFNEFINDPRNIQSGHINPLDRGGTHHPYNTFLMLSRSNQLQGNQKVDELISLMRAIVKKHDAALQENSILESRIRGT
jgi:hypothetical protein